MKSIRTNPNADAAEGDERIRTAVCAPGDDPLYEPRCENCDSDDILIRWHPSRAKNRSASCREHMSVLDYGRLPESHDEHLHHVCRRCQFQWLTPTRKAVS